MSFVETEVQAETLDACARLLSEVTQENNSKQVSEKAALYITFVILHEFNNITNVSPLKIKHCFYKYRKRITNNEKIWPFAVFKCTSNLFWFHKNILTSFLWNHNIQKMIKVISCKRLHIFFSSNYLLRRESNDLLWYWFIPVKIIIVQERVFNEVWRKGIHVRWKDIISGQKLIYLQPI